MKDTRFYALISRMKYITRWSLMRNAVGENIQEHSHMVAVIAHALGVIGNRIYGKHYNPEHLATVAMFHDATEILTGDMPTPIKYYNPDIKVAYKQVERIAGERLLQMLPPELAECYTDLILEEDEEIAAIVKAADKLSAYIKCVEEQKAGNTEFDSAEVTTMQAMLKMDRPELGWFIENCLEPFRLNLDQL